MKLKTCKSLSLLLVLGFLISYSTLGSAEPAPVYDADNMFEGSDQQDLPPPPAPDQGGTFVPMQRETAGPRNGYDDPDVNSLSLDQKVKRLEQQIKNMQASGANVQVDSLQSQIQSLRAQVEDLTHQLQQIQSQQKILSTEVEKKLATSSALKASTLSADSVDTKLTRKPPTVKSNLSDNSTDQTKSIQPNVAEEQQIYQTAYNFIKAKKFPEAVTTLQNMLQKYPSGQFASNAHYWLGELYGVMGKNDQALAEFNVVVKNYVSSPRVSDAQLKLGLIYATQSKWKDAKVALKKVINQYPGTTPARLAMEQLKQIKQAGH